MYIYIYMCIYLHVYMYVYVCIYVYIYMCVYIHISTNMYTYSEMHTIILTRLCIACIRARATRGRQQHARSLVDVPENKHLPRVRTFILRLMHQHLVVLHSLCQFTAKDCFARTSTCQFLCLGVHLLVCLRVCANVKAEIAIY